MLINFLVDDISLGFSQGLAIETSINLLTVRGHGMFCVAQLHLCGIDTVLHLLLVFDFRKHPKYFVLL